VHDNNTSGDGGGVYVNGGTFTMKGGASVHDNDTSDGGGGVYVNGGTFTMEGSASVYNNTSNVYSTGGVNVSDYGTFTMRGSASVHDNIAGGDGGGVYVGSGTFTMKDRASVYKNTSNNGNGGGVYVNDPDGYFTMEGNASVSGNFASDSSGYNNSGGGGVCIYSGAFTMSGRAKVSGNTVDLSNQASSSTNYSGGGGVYIYNADFTMVDNAEVSGNKVIAPYISTSDDYTGGGGVVVFGDVSNSASFTMEGGASVRDNTVDYQTNDNKNSSGGGVAVREYGTFTMNEDAAVSGNKAAIGGGVHVSHEGIFNMKGGAVSGNKAEKADGDGGGVTLGGSAKFYIENGTIYGKNAGVFSNEASNAAALSKNTTSTARHGTFIGNNFTGVLTATDDTIIVENGVRK
jgi:hypothetical protein